MKMIMITTGNQISVHDFPDGSISEQTKLLCKYITISHTHLKTKNDQYKPCNRREKQHPKF